MFATRPPLIDTFARRISYLRVSVTDRCDFRCVYCMSEAMEFLPKRDLLTLEELDRLCSAFIGLGITKLRITGGEPLVRRNIMSFFNAMGRHVESGALKELTVTTNGSQLERFAGDLFAAGVLTGLSQGRPIADCLTMGAVCAREIIAQVGPRAQTDLKAKVAERLA